jgi:hypothetical protein
VSDSVDHLEERIRKEYPKLYRALFGDGDDTRQELMAASLFIMTYECLKDFVEGQFKSFFTDGFETTVNGAVIGIFSPKWPEVKNSQETRYKELVKKLANIDMGKVTLFQAGCAWLHEMEAVTDDDIMLIIQISKFRNELAHELYRWLFDDSIPQIEAKIVNAPINLYFKISNWWIRNVEVSIDPEGYEHFSEEDLSSAASMNAHFLLHLVRKILPET